MDNCIFCKILKGDIPSYTVYEDEYFKVILDRFPSTLGHILILPKQHAENIYELSDESASKLLVVAKKMSIALKESLNIEGLNLLQNNGELAGQTIFHFHLHLIPRYKDDGIKVGWECINPDYSELQDTILKIKSILN